MSEVWKPSVTVAAIVHRAGRFLLVEEETSDGIRINQPAGHLDPGESLEQAVIRETMEETAHEFVPDRLVGIYLARYLSRRTHRHTTYLRFTFAGEVGADCQLPLDEGILRTLWLTRDEIAALGPRLRSPTVLHCVDDYLAGVTVPLSLLKTDPDAIGMPDSMIDSDMDDTPTLLPQNGVALPATQPPHSQLPSLTPAAQRASDA